MPSARKPSLLDVAERDRALQLLHESEARFRSAFDESAIGMALVRPDGRFVLVNRVQCEIVGYTEAQLLATNFQSISHPDDLEKDLRLVQRLLAGEIPSFKLEKRYIHKDGRVVWIDLTVSLVRDQNNQPLYLCTQVQDITDRKKTQEQLVKAKEAAEAASLAKSTFLANMSHEIRTPLTAIFGFADMLEQQDLSQAERQDFAQTIRRNGEHLLALLDDILDVSRVEAGKLVLEMTPTAPARVVEDVVTMMRDRASTKGIVLNFELAPNLPAWIETDPTRLRQILINLVGNAIKFTDKGSVTLRVGVDGKYLLVEVIDTGLGISAEQQRMIFEPFTQADASHSRKFGGAGLGLAISRRLAALLGGRIDLRSDAGRGSVFTLHLPIKLAKPAKANGDTGLPAASTLRGRVLVVEDSRDNQRLLEFLLRRFGLSVKIVGDGKQGIDAIEAAAGEPFDLVLMDMQMPVMDGYAATAELRRRGNKTPIIALTAAAMNEERERWLQIGCNEFLAKPVQPKRLLQVLNRYLLPADDDLFTALK